MKGDAISYKDLTGTHARIGARTWSESEGIESFLTRPEWQQRAACRDEDIHLFYPEKSGSYPGAVAAQVKAICAGCPVRAQCLEYALERHEYGFWGGVGEKARKAMRRTRRGEAAHGTRSRYVNQECRCDECRRANSKATARHRARQRGAA